MKNRDAGEWILFVLTGMFGAFFGLLLFFFGWFSLATEYDVKPSTGWLAGVLCPLIFCILFLTIYILKDRGEESFGAGFFSDRGDALLFGRRLMTILALPLVVWFLWVLFTTI